MKHASRHVFLGHQVPQLRRRPVSQASRDPLGVYSVKHVSRHVFLGHRVPRLRRRPVSRASRNPLGVYSMEGGI